VQRGFKAKAERMAETARSDLGLSTSDILDPWTYAEVLGVAVIGGDALDIAEPHRSQLFKLDSGSWSGLTLGYGDDTLVVLNSSHPQVRQCSTLMHELSHVRLGHIPASVQMSDTGLLLLSDYSEAQEEEADWLMGALLLPRSALLTFRSQGLGLDQIAQKFRVSDELCRWRLRMTGVEAQMRYRR
jgi:hypothetical protein